MAHFCSKYSDLDENSSFFHSENVTTCFCFKKKPNLTRSLAFEPHLELEIWSNLSKMTHSQPKMALFAAHNRMILAKISHFSRESVIFLFEKHFIVFLYNKNQLNPQITSNFVQKVENHRRDLEFTSKAL